MNKIVYDKSQIVDRWNGIEVFASNGKYGLYHPENDIVVPPLYDSMEWDHGSDFIVVSRGEQVGFLSSEDGHFIDFDDTDSDDSYMLAIPYLEYMRQELPEWMINIS